MIRILTLVAAASAYPQHFYNPYMVAPYPLQYAPLAPQPQVFPAPVVQARSEDEFDLIEDAKEARYLINFEAFQRVSGSFVADAGATVPTTITGVASFYQNPFTGQNSKYKITLNGLTSGTSYYIGLAITADQCQTIATGDETVSIEALINSSSSLSFVDSEDRHRPWHHPLRHREGIRHPGHPQHRRGRRQDPAHWAQPRGEAGH